MKLTKQQLAEIREYLLENKWRMSDAGVKLVAMLNHITALEAENKKIMKAQIEVNRLVSIKIDGFKHAIKDIDADNKLSECEGEWCGKTILKGVQQKCHHCNVKAIINRSRNHE